MVYVTYPWYTHDPKLETVPTSSSHPRWLGMNPDAFTFKERKKILSQKSKPLRKLSIENEKNIFFPGYFL